LLPGKPTLMPQLPVPMPQLPVPKLSWMTLPIPIKRWAPKVH
jgi:hypothetical protein